MNDWDREVLETWRRAKAAGFLFPEDSAYVDPKTIRNRLVLSLDMMRLNNPVVFNEICRTDIEAAEVAVQHRWKVIE